MEHPVGLPLYWCRDHGMHRDTRRGVCPVGRDLIVMRWPVAIRITFATHFPIAIGFSVATCCPIARGLLSRCPSPSRWYRDSLGGHDSACVCLGCSMVPVGVSACAPGLACPQDLQVGNATASVSAWFLLCLPRLFARCLALEDLSRSEVVSTAWDPHPREPLKERSGLRACSRARLASRGHGRRVPLLAASGGGLVVVVVTTFPHDTSKYDSPILRHQSMVAPARVASRPRGVSGAVLFVGPRPCGGIGNPYWALFARLTPLLPSARGSSSRELGVGRVAEAAVASCVVSSIKSECCELLYLSVRFPCKFRVRAVVGCSCCCVACVVSVVARCVRVVVARLAVDSLAVVFLVWRTIAGKSRRGDLGRLRCIWVRLALLLELSRCSVCHVASLVERCDTCLWLLSALCWLVVSSGEVEVHRLVALCSSEVSQNPFVVLNGALVVLVEVLSGPACIASAVLLAVVFSLKLSCAIWIGYVLARFCWAQNTCPFTVFERDSEGRRILKATVLHVVFLLHPLSGCRLHAHRVSRAGRHADVGFGKASPYPVALSVHVVCVCVTSSTTPTVVTSSVGCPRFCVIQARVFVLWACPGTCVVPSRSVSSVLDTLTPVFELYVRLREIRQWDSDLVPRSVRHWPAAVWCYLVSIVVWLVLVERQLDLSSVAARLIGVCIGFGVLWAGRLVPKHLPLLSGCRLHARRVSRAGRHANVSLGKASPYPIALRDAVRSTRPGEGVVAIFGAIRRFGGVFDVFSPQGSCVEREKHRESVVLRILHKGVRFPCKFRVRAVVGCSCCCVACVVSVVARCVRVVVARLAVDSLTVVFLVWRTIAGKSRRGALGRLRCSVCHVASLVERCDTCLWLLSALCWLVVSSGEVEVHRLVALCSSEVSQNPFVVVLNGALVVLVEVLSGPACIASAVLLAVVFSLKFSCAIWIGYVLARFCNVAHFSDPRWAQNTCPFTVFERDSEGRRILKATVLHVVFLLHPLSGCRLHAHRVSHAGRHADVGFGKASPYPVALSVHVVCVCVTSSTTPTVVTSSVGCPRFCVIQARVFVLWACPGTCVVPSRSVSSVLDTLTPVFELYVRLRERRQWDSDLELRPGSLEVSGMGLRLCGPQVWCYLVSIVVWLVLVERQLDLSSVAARLIGWSQNTCPFTVCERDSEGHRILKETVLHVAFLFVYVVCVCVASSTMPTVVTSSVGCPRFCVSQGHVFVLGACPSTCVVPSRSVSSILDTLTPVFEFYIRLRERRQWDSDLELRPGSLEVSGMGLRLCVAGVANQSTWLECGGLYFSTYTKFGLLDFWGSFPTEPVNCEAHLYSLQVKESKRFLYRLPVQSRIAGELGRRLQQCSSFFSCTSGVHVVCVCVACSTTPTVVTSSVGCPKFCVSQARVFVLGACPGTCVVTSRSVSSVLDTITPVFDLYIRLRERRQWDNDLCGAFDRVSGRCTGLVALLFAPKFLDCACGTSCVPVLRVVCFVSRTLRALLDGGLSGLLVAGPNSGVCWWLQPCSFRLAFAAIQVGFGIARHLWGCRPGWTPHVWLEVAVAVPFPIAMGWLALRTFRWGTRQVTWLRSVIEGDTFVAVSGRQCQLARVCLGWPTALLRVCVCLALVGLVVVYKPAFRHAFEGVFGATSVLELAAELADTEAEEKMSPVLGRQSMVALARVTSGPRGMSGVGGGSVCRPSTLWRSEVVVLVVFESVDGDANFGSLAGVWEGNLDRNPRCCPFLARTQVRDLRTRRPDRLRSQGPLRHSTWCILNATGNPVAVWIPDLTALSRSLNDPVAF
ncbi:hypothetical protein Taro_038953 [Colocasia esculenta]|uniref:Uncharacterized protein n=1 Tax=Colocasia esculenta TaxID=4460 RepID=A0A843W4Z0_COLES|nr:hypothetical protein [Colocasia esculenta]